MKITRNNIETLLLHDEEFRKRAIEILYREGQSTDNPTESAIFDSFIEDVPKTKIEAIARLKDLAKSFDSDDWKNIGYSPISGGNRMSLIDAKEWVEEKCDF